MRKRAATPVVLLWATAALIAAAAMDGAGAAASPDAAALAGGPVGATFQISDLDHDQVKPAVAYGSQRGEYLVVWRNDWPGNDDIYAQRVSADGQLIGSWVAIAWGAGAERSWPAVAYNSRSDEYLAVWQSDDGTSTSIRGRLVSGTLQLQGSEIAVSGGLSLADCSKPAVAYGYSSDRYIVTWERRLQGASASDIEVQALAPPGVLDGSNFLLVQGTPGQSNERPALAYNRARNELLVAWQRPTGSQMDVYARRMRLAGGAAPLGQVFAIADLANAESEPAVAALPVPSGDGQYAVVFRMEISGAGSIMGLHVSGDGVPAGMRFQVEPPTSPPAVPPDLVSPAIAADESSEEYLVAWIRTWPLIAQRTVGAQLITSQGGHVGNEASLGGEVADRPAVAGAGSGSYLVAFDDRPPFAANRDVYGRLWGTEEPTATPTASWTASPEPTNTATPTTTSTSTRTSTPTPTEPEPTVTLTSTATIAPSATTSPPPSVTASPRVSNTPLPPPSATVTQRPSATTTAWASATPTAGAPPSATTTAVRTGTAGPTSSASATVRAPGTSTPTKVPTATTPPAYLPIALRVFDF